MGEYRRDLARSAICQSAAHFSPSPISVELDLNGPFSGYRVCYDPILSALCSSTSATATERGGGQLAGHSFLPPALLEKTGTIEASRMRRSAG